MTVFIAEGGSVVLGASPIGTVQSFDKLEDRFEPFAGKSDGTTAELEVPVIGTTNYNDFTMTGNITAKDKEQVTITGLTAATGLVYNGSTQILTLPLVRQKSQ